MQVLQYYLNNTLRNFNYVIYSVVTREAIIVDPYDIEAIKALCEKNDLKIKYLINTHHHPDHIKDNEKAMKISGIEYLKLKDKQEFQLSQNEKIRCIDTPGHTMDHQCFLIINDDKVEGIISGDTIFNAGVGNCKNGGNVDILFHTISKLNNELPDEAIIYPSHDYMLTNLKFAKSVETSNLDVDKMILKKKHADDDQSFFLTTMSEERRVNIFFRAVNGDFEDSSRGREPLEVFRELRSLRDRW